MSEYRQHSVKGRIAVTRDIGEAQITLLKEFILPGGSVLAAQLHVARTVCR
ncbi:MAG TPA: ATP:cob(I)alamin adenosyltransferase [Phycisphaerae bacterium]|nr:ATP:cob(I)alamin adenosyltransferase [Phycisphaerae bacterium]